jgi:hypothetical protein
MLANFCIVWVNKRALSVREHKFKLFEAENIEKKKLLYTYVRESNFTLKKTA